MGKSSNPLSAAIPVPAVQTRDLHGAADGLLALRGYPLCTAGGREPWVRRPQPCWGSVDSVPEPGDCLSSCLSRCQTFSSVPQCLPECQSVPNALIGFNCLACDVPSPCSRRFQTRVGATMHRVTASHPDWTMCRRCKMASAVDACFDPAQDKCAA